MRQGSPQAKFVSFRQTGNQLLSCLGYSRAPVTAGATTKSNLRLLLEMVILFDTPRHLTQSFLILPFSGQPIC
jgi:hypothetical protein